jgi:hypothetical protein
MIRILKLVWLALALLVLLTGHLKLDAGANRDWDIVTLAVARTNDSKICVAKIC